jgi:hypothetical protein
MLLPRRTRTLHCKDWNSSEHEGMIAAMLRRSVVAFAPLTVAVVVSILALAIAACVAALGLWSGRAEVRRLDAFGGSVGYPDGRLSMATRDNALAYASIHTPSMREARDPKLSELLRPLHVVAESDLSERARITRDAPAHLRLLFIDEPPPPRQRSYTTARRPR